VCDVTQQLADDEPPLRDSARSQTEIWMRRLRPGFTLGGGRIPWSFPRAPCERNPINLRLLDNTAVASIMTTISKDNKLVTLINVFTVEPGKQQELVALLIHATESSMCHVPGFISANIHRSLDGTKVANYAQWRSVEDFQSMLKNPAALPHMQQAAALAKFEHGLYEVVETHFNEPRNA
jgi:heme-degrading monooxygenase HmoA